MIYIYYVHSHITYYVSKAVIKKLKQEENNVFFIIARNYKNVSLDVSKCLDVSEIHDEIGNIYLKDFYKTHKYINQVDLLLSSKFQNKEFTLFLPNLRNHLIQILATNKNCKEIHMIEVRGTEFKPNFLKILKGHTVEWKLIQ